VNIGIDEDRDFITLLGGPASAICLASDSAKPCSDRLVGLRIAKICQQPVALVLGHKTAIALDQFGAAAVIGADDAPQIFGSSLPDGAVEPTRSPNMTARRCLAASVWSRRADESLPGLRSQTRQSPPAACGDRRARRRGLRGPDRSNVVARRNRCGSRQSALRTRTCRVMPATPQSWTRLLPEDFPPSQIIQHWQNEIIKGGGSILQQPIFAATVSPNLHFR
jgi:hypothetical protein